MKKAAEEAHEAANNLQEKEAQLSEITEDMARLMARYQSAKVFAEIKLLTNSTNQRQLPPKHLEPRLSRHKKKQKMILKWQKSLLIMRCCKVRKPMKT